MERLAANAERFIIHVEKLTITGIPQTSCTYIDTQLETHVSGQDL